MSSEPRKKKPFMPLYPADYFEATYTLEPEEHGVYCVLIFTAWQRDGILPGNINDLRLLIGTKMPKLHGNRFNKLVLPILERFFFTDSEGNHRHKRVEKELETAEKLSRKQKENVEKRYAVSNENNNIDSKVVEVLVLPRAPVLHSQSQSHIELEANDESIPHPASPTAVDDQRPSAEPGLFGEDQPPAPAKPKTIKIKDAFEQFYAAYPLKKERVAAFKAFEKAMKSGQVTFSKLLAGVEDYKRLNAPDTRWKYPATWLNKGCWADEYEAQRPTPVLAFRNDRAPTAIDQRTDFKNFIAGKVAKHFGGPEPPREPFDVTDQATVIEH